MKQLQFLRKYVLCCIYLLLKALNCLKNKWNGFLDNMK